MDIIPIMRICELVDKLTFHIDYGWLRCHGAILHGEIKGFVILWISMLLFSFSYTTTLLKVYNGLNCSPERYVLHPNPWYLGIMALIQKRVFADAIDVRIPK